MCSGVSRITSGVNAGIVVPGEVHLRAVGYSPGTRYGGGFGSPLPGLAGSLGDKGADGLSKEASLRHLWAKHGWWSSASVNHVSRHSGNAVKPTSLKNNSIQCLGNKEELKGRLDLNPNPVKQ